MTDTLKDKANLKADFTTGEVITESKMSDLITSLAEIPVVIDLGNVSGSVTTDVVNGSIFTAVLTDNITLENPTGAINGQGITWYLTQGGTGSYTVTLGDKFALPDKATDPLAWSNVVGKMDMLAVRYWETNDKFLVVSMVGGY
jgi:hypothetical protein